MDVMAVMGMMGWWAGVSWVILACIMTVLGIMVFRIDKLPLE